ncbi:hypothetical protein H4R18_004242 [Coemansia javaensis]|uniref:Peptidase S1 domain-containing protein n=1 Tax=Coemansia javaensis TaxID=2761396 RepID=A0A9W8HA07_9FUNG|nr:hypothetical protein H4R18_004242 [Coemansia javaensis]
MVGRIVGGSTVPEGKYPFAVRLEIASGGDDYLCGGTLIASDLVVTAAHCVVEPEVSSLFAPEEINVCYGSSSVAAQKCTPAVNVTVHPQYNPTVYSNDIALIRIAPLASNNNSNGGVGAAAIYTGKLPENTTLITMGWGKTSSNSSALPTTLMSTEIKIGSRSACRQAQPGYQSSDGPDVCTVNALTPGRDSCQGDSGSPTVVAQGASVLLAALTSSGVDLSNPGAADCAMPNGLAFYTHVYYYMDFITATSGRPASAFTGSAKSSGDSASDGESGDSHSGAATASSAALAALLLLLMLAAL